MVEIWRSMWRRKREARWHNAKMEVKGIRFFIIEDRGRRKAKI